MVINADVKRSWKTMCDHYYLRTNRHIDLVQKYCQRIHERFNIFPGIVQRGLEHDDSKFLQPELIPYIVLTWQYKCKDEGINFQVDKRVERLIHEATEHHVLTNDHHPEFHCPKDKMVINEDDRDEPPEQIIDARSMGILPIAEMVADWCAMSEERGNTPKEWADKNVGIRWRFDKDQKHLIYGLLTEIWEV